MGVLTLTGWARPGGGRGRREGQGWCRCRRRRYLRERRRPRCAPRPRAQRQQPHRPVTPLQPAGRRKDPGVEAPCEVPEDSFCLGLLKKSELNTRSPSSPPRVLCQYSENDVLSALAVKTMLAGVNEAFLRAFL